MDQEKTYKWIQDRLRDLNSGKLSEEDRIRLVEIAKNDPFVADALEGYHLHPGLPHTQHLDLLARKIAHGKRTRRRWLIPNLTVTAIAASLLLIIATWAVINRMDPDEETIYVMVSPDSLMAGDTVFENIAVAHDESTELPDDASTISSTSTTTSPPTTNPSDNKASSAKSVQPGSGEITTEARRISDSDELTESEPVYSGPPVAPAVILDQHDLVEETIEDATKTTEVISLKDDGYYANQMNPDVMARRVTGRVMDEGGQPLIGANLIVRNTNLGATSDLNGRFELYLPMPEAEVDVSLTGYEDTNVILQQGEEDAIVTIPSFKMRAIENVLGGQAAGAQKNAKSGPVTKPGDLAKEPVSEFTTFIKENSRFTLRDNFYSPGKDVTVEFTISNAGKPGNIRIISSSGNKAYDDETVRLIKKGPDWVCDGDQYPCVRRYTIYFQ